MTNKKMILLLISIISIGAILIAVLIIFYNAEVNNKNINVEQSDLYFVTQDVESKKYGVSKNDGTVILESKYTQIARVNDSVYLRGDDNSYIFFLNNETDITLGGKESQVYFVYDKKNILLPYYVLRYGEDEQTSIYRIFNDMGERYSNKDFASLNNVYEFLDAKEVFELNVINENLMQEYNLISNVMFSTIEGKSQYIVTKKNDEKGLEGIIDEDGKVLLDFNYQNISEITDSQNALKVEKDNSEYLFLSNSKLIEVESEFEFVISDEYIIQKRGNTVNKIYNIFGEIVVDGIYNLENDLTPLNLQSGVSYMLVQETKDKYWLYNLSTNSKVDKEYTGLFLDYIVDYSSENKNTGLIYNNNSKYFALDLNSLESYELKNPTSILSPLDLGIVYK